MAYDNELVAQKLEVWDKYLDKYRLPTWEQIPNMGLYMDQVISLVGRYLDKLFSDTDDITMITPSTINNYVRLKIMPAPRKKRYYREHIAYLIVICSLKQSMSMSNIQKILPADLDEEGVKKQYEAYVAQFAKMARFFLIQSRLTAMPVVQRRTDSDDAVEDLVRMGAILSVLFKIMSERIIDLQLPEPEEANIGVS